MGKGAQQDPSRVWEALEEAVYVIRNSARVSVWSKHFSSRDFDYEDFCVWANHWELMHPPVAGIAAEDDRRAALLADKRQADPDTLREKIAREVCNTHYGPSAPMIARKQVKHMVDSKQAMVTFKMDGGDYAFVMPADSLEDAERRLRAIRTTGVVLGWPAYTHRANVLTLPFVAAWTYGMTALRNLFGVRS